MEYLMQLLTPTSLAGTAADSALEYPYFLDVSELEGYLRTIKTTPNTSPAVRADDTASYSTNVDAALNAVSSEAFLWNFFTGRQSLFQRGFPVTIRGSERNNGASKPR